MDLLSGSLSETRSYSARSWTWIGRTDPCDLHDGTLTVQLTHGKTRRAGVETRRYFVQEIPSDMPGRCFLFLKDEQPDANQSDIYRVDATEFGVLCSCKASQCHAPGCVHADALAALLAAGAFDPAPLPVTLAEIDDRAACVGGQPRPLLCFFAAEGTGPNWVQFPDDALQTEDRRGV